MKAILAVAVLVTSAPAVAVAAADEDSARPQRERRVCTQVQRYGGSRVAYQRVCLTEAEWRERLGPDWRQRLAGRSPDDDLDGVDARTREWSNVDGFYGTSGGIGTPPGAPR